MPNGPRELARTLLHGFTRRSVSGPGVEIAPTVRLIGKPEIRAHPGSRIVVRDRAELLSSTRRASMVLSHPAQLTTFREGALIDVGEDVGISGATICAVLSVEIGARTLIGTNAMVLDTGFHPLSPVDRRYHPIPEPRDEDRVILEEDVFIGASAIVLPGAHVGAGSVVGAHAVVSGKIPPGVIVAGNPARVIRDL